MRVITRGTPPEQKTYRTTCLHCATLFEFEALEAKYVSDQRDGDFLSIECPVCSAPVAVKP